MGAGDEGGYRGGDRLGRIEREIGELAGRVSSLELRVDKVEDKTETSGQHEVADLRQKLAEMDRHEQQRKLKEADEAKAIAKERQARRYEILKAVVTIIVSSAVGYGVAHLDGCRAQAKPASSSAPVSSAR